MKYVQKPWRTPAVFLKMCSTREAHIKYPCGCGVFTEEFSIICHLSKSLMGMALMLHMRVCSTCEAHLKYLKSTPKVSMGMWEVPLRHTQNTHEGKYTHFHSSKVIHKYCGCTSQGLHMLLDVSHRYCTPSWVLRILYTRWHWMPSALMTCPIYQISSP